MTVFCIPTQHAAAKDGYVYIEPLYSNTAHMKDDFEYILADASKFRAKIERDNPDFWAHVERKFSGTTTEGWLRDNSEQSPLNLGNWGYSLECGLRMSSGEAALLKVVEELGLPYVPLTLNKLIGHEMLDKLREEIGYAGNSRPILKRLRPTGHDA